MKILSRDRVYSGFNKITNYKFEFESFDKKDKLVMEKEIIERKDAIAIVLYDDNRDKLLLIQQFRPGCFVKKDIRYPFEIVAGLVENDISIEDTIVKEVKEEVGCDIVDITKIGSFFPEISFSSREIHLFYANFDSSNVKKYAGLKSENEDIRIFLFSKNEVLNMIRKNEIINSHSLIGLQWFFLNGV
ncbi:MAG: NUDIX hydrolase [Rickettsiales bacterium]|jgi:ADP-ribose pyrophosphatase|nr:NUDIX hydrolase [Rickettsiales bacterium]